MAGYPSIYTITYSYTGFQQAQGDNSFPGAQLDADLAGLHDSVADLATFLEGVARSDGALQNGVVTYDSLSVALQTNGLGPAVAWATATKYLKNNAVVTGGSLYRALSDHTSGTFATDLAAGKWVLVGALTAGPQGIQGIQGIQGAQGVKGDTGPTGPLSAPGTTVVNAIAVYANTFGTALLNTLATISTVGAFYTPDDTTSATGRFVVGTGGALNSNYAAYRVARVWTASGLSPHGFADNTTFNAPGAIGACSFDSRINIVGSNNMDHFNSVQSIMAYGSTGILDNHVGYNWTPSITSTGKVTAMTGASYGNPQISGGGSTDSVIAVFIDNINAGGGFNRGLYGGGTTVHELGGNVISGTQFEVQNAFPALKFSTALGVATRAALFDDGSNLTLKSYVNNSVFVNVNAANVTETKTNLFRPATDNVASCGDSTHRWTQLFAATATIGTSDATLKTPLHEPPQQFYEAILSVPLGTYQWLDAIAAKGADKARWHYGPMAQDVRDALAKAGLDPNSYAMFCENPKTRPVTKTRTRQQQVVEEKEIDFPNVTMIDGVATKTTYKRVEKHYKVDRVPLFEADGSRAMRADPNLPKGSPLVEAFHDEPVMETITEQYVEDEPTGATILGLRMEQFILARLEAMRREAKNG